MKNGTPEHRGSSGSENLVLLTMLHMKRALTKTEIGRATRLSHPTVTNALRNLSKTRDVFENDARWTANADAFYVIGIAIKTFVKVRRELGGFEIKWEVSGVVTNRAGESTNISWMPPEEERDQNTEYDHVVTEICRVIQWLKTRAHEDGKLVAAVGIEMGGHIDAKAGCVHYSPSFNWTTDKFIATDVANKVDLLTVVENDANAFALYETMNPDRPSRFAVVLLSEAVGGAIVDKRRLLHGTTGGAGEIGHIPIAGGTEVCQCGQIGCLQSIASYAAIREAAGDRPVSWVVREADLGATTPREVLDKAAWALSFGIAAIECIVQPDQIIISSTCMANSMFFQTQLDLHLRKHRFKSFDVDISYISTSMRNLAVGAAWAAIIKHPQVSCPVPTVRRQLTDSTKAI